MPRPKMKECRNGHPMKDPNLIYHTRIHKKTGETIRVRECRQCVNDRTRAQREARKRNAELMKGEV